MNNFNFLNFVILNQALKKLPPKKRSSFSAIGALGTGGLGGIVPAFALGKAEIAKNDARIAEGVADNLVAQMARNQEATQQIWTSFARNGTEKNRKEVAEETVLQRTTLGLAPVFDEDGKQLLPGAETSLAPVVGGLTLDTAELGKGIGEAIAGALSAKV